MPRNLPLQVQFGSFVAKYAPPNSRVNRQNISRFPGSHIGDIANHSLGVSFGYWVHPHRYMRHMKLVLDSLAFQTNSRVITLGIDGGLFEVFLAKHVLGEKGKITAFVTDRHNLEIAQRIAHEEGVSDKVTFQIFDHEKLLQLPKWHFDAAFSIATLHTIPEQSNVISEFKRVLKPSGRALLMYSAPYMQTKHGVTEPAFLRIVRNHFSITRHGFALTPRSSLTIYGERERELRRQRGFGISQKYLRLKPRA